MRCCVPLCVLQLEPPGTRAVKRRQASWVCKHALQNELEKWPRKALLNARWVPVSIATAQPLRRELSSKNAIYIHTQRSNRVQSHELPSVLMNLANRISKRSPASLYGSMASSSLPTSHRPGERRAGCVPRPLCRTQPRRAPCAIMAFCLPGVVFRTWGPLLLGLNSEGACESTKRPQKVFDPPPPPSRSFLQVGPLDVAFGARDRIEQMVDLPETTYWMG